ncbi:MAG: adenylate/guanylate cyclase domain-containing protein [Anaerolineae bacterium]|nr:adenylate/guanylate cyclase domain-containing protein [Anaerolineae bacterium]
MPAKIDEAVLEQRLTALEQAHSWSPRVVSKLETFIRTADDYDLFRVNPVQYGSSKAMSEAEAVDLFIYAAKVGLFEMDWNMLCAFCPQVVGSFRELEKVHSHFICPFCNAVNDIALDDYIQVTFTLSRQVRDNIFLHPESLSVEDYYLRYHFAKGFKVPEGLTPATLIALLTKMFIDIEAQQKRSFDFELPVGRFEVVDLSHKLMLALFVKGQDVDTQSTQIQLSDGKFHVLNRETGPRYVISGVARLAFRQAGEMPPGKHSVEIENRMDERGRFWILQYPPTFENTYFEYEPFLSGKRLLTTQTFRNLFRTQVIDETEGIAVNDLTYLFTDLKGSTQLYDTVGDGNAYFLVRQHFDTLSKVVAARSGVIVKTIGDAIMAAFEKPENGVAAAIEMIEELAAFNKTISHPLSLKIGIHRGRSIAVTLNDRLDYFGQNVNIAARIQSLADANEIYMSREMMDSPGVSDILKDHHVTPDQVQVKGVSEKLEVYRVTVK